MPQPSPQPTKAFVSLSELAEDILGLSRARVYELIERGALPQPLYDLRTRRPMFSAELIEQARTVRQTGIGTNGLPLIFYRRDRTRAAPSSATSRRRPRPSKPQAARNAEIVASLQALGVSATEQAVSEAIARCFPSGTDGQQEDDVIRAVFRLLRSQHSA